MNKTEIYDLWLDCFYQDKLTHQEYSQLIRMLLTDRDMLEWFRIEYGLFVFLK